MIMTKFTLSKEGWFSGEGSESDIVVSSRIRFDRNLDSFAFPKKMENDDFDLFSKKIMFTAGQMADYRFYPSNNLKLADRQLLVERHYVKPEMLFNKEQFILIKENEEVIVLFNDTDHIRIKSIKSGLDLRSAYNACNSVDNFFEEKFDYAWSSKYGYLTSNIAEAGNGMSASVMLFLPGIQRAGKLEEVISEIVRVGFDVKGFSHSKEESEKSSNIDKRISFGDIYIVENRFSIGKTEEEIILWLENITNIIGNYERETRDVLVADDRISLEDEFYRAKGILENARKISYEEAVKHLSSLKMGKYYNFSPKNITYGKINCLLNQIQKSHILKNSITESDENVLRAEYIRNNLAEKNERTISNV